MTISYKEMIRQRRSVRTFREEALHEEDLRAVKECISSLENPFGIPITFQLLNAKMHGLSSPVIVGADTYVAAKVKRVPCCEIAYGYCFEQFCLYALSRRIGTAMLAASLSRAAFEKAMGVQPDEVMPVASPVGYPAEKKSMREGLMRKGLKADDRKPFDSIFFDKTFELGLKKENAAIFADALEAAKWAPSAGNMQPWRAVLCGDTVHFYEAKSMKDSPLGDIQKVDVGIALAHFDLTMQENGESGRFIDNNPGITLPENVKYIISYKRKA